MRRQVAVQVSFFQLGKIFKYVLGLGTLCTMVVLVTFKDDHPQSATVQYGVSTEQTAEKYLDDIRIAVTTRELNNTLVVPESERTTRVDTVNRTPAGYKSILIWNSFFGEPDYGVGGFGTTAFDRSNCPHTCWTTSDQDQLEYADAVLVHTFNMGPSFQDVKMPKRTNKKQIFVFFILESPTRSYSGFQDTGYSFKDVFNLTFSFLDSPLTDVYMPMGGMQLREEPSDHYLPSLDAIRTKTLVAWFVSNCNAPSARLEYAQELAKHMPVHIYGDCGNFTCPPGEIKCYSKIIQSYLFYLAFENSFCQDYATEKLFRTLTTHMVPIIYGYGNYSKLLPEKSYIDVRDYSSPRELARYLLLLQKFPRKYMEYMQWKREYSVLQEGDFKAFGFCKLCSILHTEGYPYKSNFNPVEGYWNPDQLCLSGDLERKAVHLVY